MLKSHAQIFRLTDGAIPPAQLGFRRCTTTPGPSRILSAILIYQSTMDVPASSAGVDGFSTQMLE